MEMQNNGQGYPTCNCPHHKVIPGLIALLGLLFFLHAFGVFSQHVVDIIWPLIVLLIGVNKMFMHKCNCCSRDK